MKKIKIFLCVTVFFFLCITGKAKCSAETIDSKIGNENQIGDYSEDSNGVSHVGVVLKVDGNVKYFALDTWCKENGIWNYVGSYVDGLKYKVDNRVLCEYPIWLLTSRSYPNRFQLIMNKIMEDLKLTNEYSVVLQKYEKGKLVSKDVEYSFETNSDRLGELSTKQSCVLLSNYKADAISYKYNIYSSQEIAPGAGISVNANGGKYESPGKAYNTENGYYIQKLPTASFVKTGYQTTMEGWYDAAEGGKEYKEGDIIPMGTCLYAHWKIKPNLYPVTCIDILGTDITDKELGRNSWNADYNSVVRGSNQGNSTESSAYYENYTYVNDSIGVVGTNETFVYRFFKKAIYDVEYIDIIKKGEKTGTVLKTIKKSKEYDTSVSATEMGNSTKENEYYIGYYLSECTSTKVTSPDTKVYRYFFPIEYEISFYKDDTTTGEMPTIKNCSYDSEIKLPDIAFQKKCTIKLNLNHEKATCQNSELLSEQEFLGWSLHRGGNVELKNQESIRNITNRSVNIMLYPVWSESKIKLSVLPQLSGYQFVGWSQDSMGKQKIYPLNSEFTVNDFDVDLYAIWKPLSCTIQYNANIPNNPDTMIKKVNFDEMDTLEECNVQNTGYQFKEWNTMPDGSGHSILSMDDLKKITINDGRNIILYAQWNPKKIIISYDKNSSQIIGSTITNTISDEEYDYDKDYYASKSCYEAVGYKMIAWNTKADGSGINIMPGEKLNTKIDCEKNITLYAIWQTNCNTKLQIEIYDNETKQIKDTITITGMANEKVETALKRAYKEKLDGEDAKYFYEGYEIFNEDILNKTLSDDSNSKIDVYVKNRTCTISFVKFEKEKEITVYNEDLLYGEEIKFPSIIKDCADIYCFQDEKDNKYFPLETMKVKKNQKIYIMHSVYVNSTLDDEKIDTVVDGKNYILPEMKKNGYEFLGWYKDEKFNSILEKSNQILSEIHSNIKLYAKWSEPLQYTISYEMDSTKFKFLDNPVLTYQYMQEISLPTKNQICAEGNYEFLGWYDKEDSKKTPIFKLSAGNYGNKTLCMLFQSTNDEQNASNVINPINNSSQHTLPISNTLQKKSSNTSDKTIASKNINLLHKKFWYNKMQYSIVSIKKGKEKVTLCATKSNSKKVSIPKKVKYGKIYYSVTSISKKVFYKKNKITEIVVGDGVENINSECFSKMNKLSKITLGNNVTSISQNAFKNSKKLKKVIIKGTKIKKISKNAFQNIGKKCTFTIKKSKQKTYRTLLKKSGKKNGYKFQLKR